MISIAVALTGTLSITYGFLFDNYLPTEPSLVLGLTFALRTMQGLASACV